MDLQPMPNDAEPQPIENSNTDVINTPEIAGLMELHQVCRRYIEAKAWVRFRNFLYIFNSDSVDINVLKTILVITKAFKEHETIKDIRKQLFDIYKIKYDKL